MTDSDINDYPVAVFEDRYMGTYSGGLWVAIACAAMLHETGCTRAQFCLIAEDGPSGSDSEAATFWANPPDWIAVGFTPDTAEEALRERMASKSSTPIASASTIQAV